jgi:hypothetical protein
MRSLVKAAHEALYDALEAEVFYKGWHEEVAGEPYGADDFIYLVEEGLEFFLEGGRGLGEKGGQVHAGNAESSSHLIVEGFGEVLALLLLCLEDALGLTSFQKQAPTRQLVQSRFILYDGYP